MDGVCLRLLAGKYGLDLCDRDSDGKMICDFCWCVLVLVSSSLIVHATDQPLLLHA